MTYTISYDLENNDVSGKHKFLSRLRPEMEKLGFLESKSKKTDFHLCVRNPKRTSKINILRLDGIWINSDKPDTNKRNKDILDNIAVADGVVFQNEFCRDAAVKILNVSHPNIECILNGAPASEFNIAAAEYPRPYFMGMCKWRSHKRLQDTIDGFLEANIPDVDLLVFGEPDYSIKNKKIRYMGWGGSRTLASYLKGAIASVHLAWLDWCPNSVVESLVAGTPVIYADSGGTKHVVKDRGWAVKDHDWDFKMLKLHSPPKLDMKNVAEAYRKAHEERITVNDVSDLEISGIARKYADFMIKTLNKVV